MFLLLHRFPSVFALHFVNGVPHNDVTACSFGYADAQYAVTVVIQHKERENLFISWSRQSDGELVHTAMCIYTLMHLLASPVGL